MKKKLLMGLGILTCAASAAFYNCLPTLGKGALNAAGDLLLFFISTSPLVILALIVRHRYTLMIGNIHLSLFVVVLFVGYMISSPDRGSAGSAFVPLILTVVIILIVLELALVMRSENYFHKQQEVLKYSIFSTCAAALSVFIMGWGLGIIVWSFLHPTHVMKSAEHIADGRAYCIEASKDKHIKSVLGLNALKMYGNTRGGITDFHGVLLVQGENEKEFYLWSYRLGVFYKVSKGAYYLDRSVRCQPKQDFVAQLSWI